MQTFQTRKQVSELINWVFFTLVEGAVVEGDSIILFGKFSGYLLTDC